MQEFSALNPGRKTRHKAWHSQLFTSGKRLFDIQRQDASRLTPALSYACALGDEVDVATYTYKTSFLFQNQ